MKDDALKPGQGKVVEINGEKVAMFKKANGEIVTLSAVCTHMGCAVEWNGTDASWDCPCHGSRFAAEGKVIHGPADKDLPKKSV